MRRIARAFLVILACTYLAAGMVPRGAEGETLAEESPAAAVERRERLRKRRQGTIIICHRGASEFAHENTLEAYRATFELGADGNEIDIRATRDGVLVCFHDDMLEQLLVAYGDCSDFTWAELKTFRFRQPGRFAEACRIPRLAEVFELHRQHAGLMHLDIKRPGLDPLIAQLLDQLDMWDHVISCNADNGDVILRDARWRPCRYKAAPYHDHGDVFPSAIAAVLELPGDALLVDDPRASLLALSKPLGRVSNAPVSPPPHLARPVVTPSADEATLRALLSDDRDWDRVAETDAERRTSALKIQAQARAADELGQLDHVSPETLQALHDRVARRSLHRDWQFHGLDGAMALRSLILLRAPTAVSTAREALWRDDPALAQVANPLFDSPRSWTDFRIKLTVFRVLSQHPGPASEALCREYLALPDDHASQLGPPQFEQAARALMSISPRSETAIELLQHRLQLVRGRAVLDCLAQLNEPWARTALETASPHSLALQVGE